MITTVKLASCEILKVEGNRVMICILDSNQESGRTHWVEQGEKLDITIPVTITTTKIVDKDV